MIMPTYEGLRLKIQKVLRKLLAKRERKNLHHTDFTIISNNCWGGMVYESYDLPKATPTVGLFFMAKDYIKFLSDLKGYTKARLRFIEPSQSRWKNSLVIKEDKRFGQYPIGELTNGIDSIEIFFLHYHTKREAKEKWERRCQRINWDKLIVKFNDQNECTEVDIDYYAKLPYANKLFFTCKEWPKQNEYKYLMDGYCLINQWPRKDSIMASYEPYGKTSYINITRFINNLNVKNKHINQYHI